MPSSALSEMMTPSRQQRRALSRKMHEVAAAASSTHRDGDEKENDGTGGVNGRFSLGSDAASAYYFGDGAPPKTPHSVARRHHGVRRDGHHRADECAMQTPGKLSPMREEDGSQRVEEEEGVGGAHGRHDVNPNDVSGDTVLSEDSDSSSDGGDALNKSVLSDTTELTASNFVFAASSRHRLSQAQMQSWQQQLSKQSQSQSQSQSHSQTQSQSSTDGDAVTGKDGGRRAPSGSEIEKTGASVPGGDITNVEGMRPANPQIRDAFLPDHSPREERVAETNRQKVPPRQELVVGTSRQEKYRPAVDASAALSPRNNPPKQQQLNKNNHQQQPPRSRRSIAYTPSPSSAAADMRSRMNSNSASVRRLTASLQRSRERRDRGRRQSIVPRSNRADEGDKENRFSLNSTGGYGDTPNRGDDDFAAKSPASGGGSAMERRSMDGVASGVLATYKASSSEKSSSPLLLAPKVRGVADQFVAGEKVKVGQPSVDQSPLNSGGEETNVFRGSSFSSSPRKSLISSVATRSMGSNGSIASKNSRSTSDSSLVNDSSFDSLFDGLQSDDDGVGGSTKDYRKDIRVHDDPVDDEPVSASEVRRENERKMGHNHNFSVPAIASHPYIEAGAKGAVDNEHEKVSNGSTMRKIASFESPARNTRSSRGSITNDTSFNSLFDGLQSDDDVSGEDTPGGNAPRITAPSDGMPTTNSTESSLGIFNTDNEVTAKDGISSRAPSSNGSFEETTNVPPAGMSDGHSSLDSTSRETRSSRGSTVNDSSFGSLYDDLRSDDEGGTIIARNNEPDYVENSPLFPEGTPSIASRVDFGRISVHNDGAIGGTTMTNDHEVPISEVGEEDSAPDGSMHSSSITYDSPARNTRRSKSASSKNNTSMSSDDSVLSPSRGGALESESDENQTGPSHVDDSRLNSSTNASPSRLPMMDSPARNTRLKMKTGNPPPSSEVDETDGNASMFKSRGQRSRKRRQSMAATSAASPHRPKPPPPSDRPANMAVESPARNTRLNLKRRQQSPSTNTSSPGAAADASPLRRKKRQEDAIPLSMEGTCLVVDSPARNTRSKRQGNVIRGTKSPSVLAEGMEDSPALKDNNRLEDVQSPPPSNSVSNHNFGRRDSTKSDRRMTADTDDLLSLMGDLQREQQREANDTEELGPSLASAAGYADDMEAASTSNATSSAANASQSLSPRRDDVSKTRKRRLSVFLPMGNSRLSSAVNGDGGSSTKEDREENDTVDTCEFSTLLRDLSEKNASSCDQEGSTIDEEEEDLQADDSSDVQRSDARRQPLASICAEGSQQQPTFQSGKSPEETGAKHDHVAVSKAYGDNASKKVNFAPSFVEQSVARRVGFAASPAPNHTAARDRLPTPHKSVRAPPGDSMLDGPTPDVTNAPSPSTPSALPFRSPAGTPRSILNSGRKQLKHVTKANALSPGNKRSRRTVAFGSPVAAEYNLGSPSMSMTPLPSKTVKEMYAMPPSHSEEGSSFDNDSSRSSSPAATNDGEVARLYDENAGDNTVQLEGDINALLLNAQAAAGDDTSNSAGSDSVANFIQRASPLSDILDCSDDERNGNASGGNASPMLCEEGSTPNQQDFSGAFESVAASVSSKKNPPGTTVELEGNITDLLENAQAGSVNPESLLSPMQRSTANPGSATKTCPPNSADMADAESIASLHARQGSMEPRIDMGSLRSEKLDFGSDNAECSVSQENSRDVSCCDEQDDVEVGNGKRHMTSSRSTDSAGAGGDTEYDHTMELEGDVSALLAATLQGHSRNNGVPSDGNNAKMDSNLVVASSRFSFGENVSARLLSPKEPPNLSNAASAVDKTGETTEIESNVDQLFRVAEAEEKLLLSDNEAGHSLSNASPATDKNGETIELENDVDQLLRVAETGEKMLSSDNEAEHSLSNASPATDKNGETIELENNVDQLLRVAEADGKLLSPDNDARQNLSIASPATDKNGETAELENNVDELLRNTEADGIISQISEQSARERVDSFDEAESSGVDECQTMELEHDAESLQQVAEYERNGKSASSQISSVSSAIDRQAAHLTQKKISLNSENAGPEDAAESPTPASLMPTINRKAESNDDTIGLATPPDPSRQLGTPHSTPSIGDAVDSVASVTKNSGSSTHLSLSTPSKTQLSMSGSIKGPFADMTTNIDSSSPAEKRGATSNEEEKDRCSERTPATVSCHEILDEVSALRPQTCSETLLKSCTVAAQCNNETVTQATNNILNAVCVEVENKAESSANGGPALLDSVIQNNENLMRQLQHLIRHPESESKDSDSALQDLRRLARAVQDFVVREWDLWEAQVAEALTGNVAEGSTGVNEDESIIARYDSLIDDAHESIAMIADRATRKARRRSLSRRQCSANALQSDIKDLEMQIKEAESICESLKEEVSTFGSLENEVLTNLSTLEEVTMLEKSTIEKEKDYSMQEGLLRWSPMVMSPSEFSLLLRCVVNKSVLLSFSLSPSGPVTCDISMQSNHVASSPREFDKYSNDAQIFIEKKMASLFTVVKGTTLASPSEIGGIVQILDWKIQRLESIGKELSALQRKWEVILEEENDGGFVLTVDFTSVKESTKLRACFDLRDDYPNSPIGVCLHPLIGEASVDIAALSRQLRKNARPGFGYITRICDVVTAFLN